MHARDGPLSGWTDQWLLWRCLWGCSYEEDLSTSLAAEDNRPRILLMGTRRSGKSSIQKVRRPCRQSRAQHSTEQWEQVPVLHCTALHSLLLVGVPAMCCLCVIKVVFHKMVRHHLPDTPSLACSAKRHERLLTRSCVVCAWLWVVPSRDAVPGVDQRHSSA